MYQSPTQSSINAIEMMSMILRGKGSFRGDRLALSDSFRFGLNLTGRAKNAFYQVTYLYTQVMFAFYAFVFKQG